MDGAWASAWVKKRIERPNVAPVWQILSLTAVLGGFAMALVMTGFHGVVISMAVPTAAGLLCFLAPFLALRSAGRRLEARIDGRRQLIEQVRDDPEDAALDRLLHVRKEDWDATAGDWLHVASIFWATSSLLGLAVADLVWNQRHQYAVAAVPFFAILVVWIVAMSAATIGAAAWSRPLRRAAASDQDAWQQVVASRSHNGP